MKYIICIIIIVILNSCYTTIPEGNIKKIDATSKIKFPLEKYIAKLKMIPLETCDSSLVGLEIKKMEIFKDKVFLLNQLKSHKNVLCFDTSGRFLFKIDKIGRAADEYTILVDFLIDSLRKKIVFLTESEFVFFDLKGNFLDKKKITPTIYPQQVILNRDFDYLLYNDRLSEPGLGDLSVWDADSMLIKQNSFHRGMFPYFTGELPLCRSDSSVLYHHFNDTVYEVTDISNREALYTVRWDKRQMKCMDYLRERTLKLPENQMLEEFLRLFWKKELCLICSIFENTRWIIVGYVKNEGTEPEENRCFNFLLYDKQANITYNSTYTKSFSHLQIVGIDGDIIYVMLYDNPQEWLNRFKEENVLPTLENEEIFKNKKEDENPILISIKLAL